MAEERILIEYYRPIKELNDGSEDRIMNQLTRAEAIEKIATGFCGGICEKCTDGPKGSEHCIKWLEIRGTMEKAETALNALFEGK